MPFLTQVRAAPNLLTMLRLFVLPFLVIAILDGHWNLAFGLILFAGLSDGFDGLLARWLHQYTTLGLYLDPIADKLLLSTLFIVLTVVGDIPRYVTILVFSRDLGILLISILLFATNTLRDFRPSFLGKVNTFIQIIAVGCLMATHVFAIPYLPQGIPWMLRAIAVLAPVSAAQYAWIVFQRISSPAEIPGPPQRPSKAGDELRG
jgi:cardiolipin synthase